MSSAAAAALVFSGEIYSGVNLTATASMFAAIAIEGRNCRPARPWDVRRDGRERRAPLLGGDLTSASIQVNAGGLLRGPGAVHSAFDEGVISGVTLAGRGGELFVIGTGRLEGVVALKGTEIFLEAGTASGDVIRSGAKEIVQGFASVVNEHIMAGGTVVYDETIGDGQTVIATASASQVLKFDGFVLRGAALTWRSGTPRSKAAARFQWRPTQTRAALRSMRAGD